MTDFRVSVTDLAQLICRRGDLEFGGVAGPSAREGHKAHQRWQANTEHATEVAVRTKVSIDDNHVTVGGRIDCLDFENQHITEIKSTLVPVEHLSEAQKALHRAQIRLYAYCLVHESCVDTQRKADWVLDVLYINLRNNSPTRDSEIMSTDEVISYGEQIVKSYVDWMQTVTSYKVACRDSAQALVFPFPSFRPGQRELASMIYRGARDSFNSLVEAPTGIGKTISTLFPAIKAMGEKDVEQVVYLTAKASGVTAVSQSLTRMTEHGLKVNAISLRSKQLTCFCFNGGCERDDQGRCPMTIGFFDRLPAAREKLFALGVITPTLMDELALEFQLCPFELSLQMLPWMNVVVCDYNYVFDPLVRLPWFSEPRRRSIVLVDEAHNLPDRSRSMFSAQLNRQLGQSVVAALEGNHSAVNRHIKAVDRALLKQVRGIEAAETICKNSPEGMRASVTGAIESLMEAMSEGPALPVEAVDWFKALCRYAAIDELYGESHRTIIVQGKYRGKKNVNIHLCCLDASSELRKIYKHYKSVSFFSATLRPMAFYKTILGVPEDTKTIQLESPFDITQSRILMVPSISTRYRQRDESLTRLVELVNDVSAAKQGSYLVFLPSFAYLEKLWLAYTARYPDQSVWKQSQGQSREERQSQLDELTQSGARLGFVILGGVFGEGVDYVGERLIGAVVIGVGLPGLSSEQDLMAEHFRGHGYDGFDFANRIPGLIRVLQTAGRVIRTESDRGVVVLVDDRFQGPFYRSNFPGHIQPVVCQQRADWVQQLRSFWSAEPVLHQPHHN